MFSKYLYPYLLFFVVGVCISCKEVPKLKNFDATSWKSDNFGCKKLRSKMLEDLERNRELLMGLSQMQITEILGKPDEQKLHKRNQKFFVYYYENSPQCAEPNKSGKYILVRFSALDAVSEIVKR
jgi:hypothetical protein